MSPADSVSTTAVIEGDPAGHRDALEEGKQWRQRDALGVLGPASGVDVTLAPTWTWMVQSSAADLRQGSRAVHARRIVSQVSCPRMYRYDFATAGIRS